jgi:hypothetical protein
MSNPFTAFFDFIKTKWEELFGTAGATLSADVTTDIHLIGSGANAILAALETIPGVSAQEFAKLQGYITQITTSAETITAEIETDVAKPVVTQIVDAFTAFEAQLAAYTLPAVVSSVVNAIKTLLPYIEAGAGVLLAGSAASSATVAASQATGLSPDEARLVLKGA